jgi:YjbE family integral membrane protein
MPDISTSLFWIAVLQIIAIDIMLGGDNAVVIALACRKLPPEQRNKGIFWGVVGAIGLRVVMVFFALQLLAVPYLKIVGALLLLWIGIKLLLPEHDEGHGNIDGGTTLMAAIKTVVVADAVMSLDNVIAVAGASHGSMVLVTFGILVSIPIIVWGSKLVLTMMDRFPVVITLGAALLGWIAGGMILTDQAMPAAISQSIPYAHYVVGGIGALTVVLIGKWLSRRHQPSRPGVELPPDTPEVKSTQGDSP